MMVHKAAVIFAIAFLSVLMLHGVAAADDFDFSGNFTFDNDVLLFGFNVDSMSTVTVFSSSWDDGGFDPMLGIWDSSGDLIHFQDDGGYTGSTMSNSVSYDHGVWDSYYTVTLATGDYFASVTQYNNFPAGSNLSDGFAHDGNPNFTFDYGWGTQPYFNGVWNIPNDPRTSDWAFHLLNVNTAVVVDVIPEPTSLLLLGTGLGVLGLAAYRRRKKQ